MKNNTILFLALGGLALYLFSRQRKSNTPNVPNANPATASPYGGLSDIFRRIATPTPGQQAQDNIGGYIVAGGNALSKLASTIGALFKTTDDRGKAATTPVPVDYTALDYQYFGDLSYQYDFDYFGDSSPAGDYDSRFSQPDSSSRTDVG